MSNLFTWYKEGDSYDYTPASDVTGGNLVQIGNRAALCLRDIAASALGSARFTGVIKGPHTATVGSIGNNVWWDANGSPVGGTALSGALTTDATAGDFWVGTLVATAAATDTEIYVSLNEVNPEQPPWINKAHVATAIDLNWAAAEHNGKVIHVTADAKTVTMPVGVAGMEAIIVNDNADAAGLISVDFNGNETLEGNLAIAATKVANNTKTTAERGDYLWIRCQTAASLWVALEKRGIWVTS